VAKSTNCCARRPASSRRRRSRRSPPRSTRTRFPADRIVGEQGTGFRTALATLDHTRITIAAQALGIAQGALDYAVGYVKERRQLGQAIADFQGVQFMLADMAMRLEAARQLLKG
jgi:alkylation response protein AidB-like acyl-CoA dehydrogenase